MPAGAELHRSKQNGLQLLRIVAAVLVMVHHATANVWGRYGGRVCTWGAGALGVDLFFVLSGFVMVYSSKRLSSFQNGWAVFAHRRIVRIVPMYWLATTVIVCAMRFMPRLFQRHGPLVIPAVCSYLFLPSRDFGGGIHPLLVVGWTLNFEMFFYALFTLALFSKSNIFFFIGLMLGCISALSLVVHTRLTAASFYLDPIVLEFFWGMLLAHTGAQARRKVWVAVPVLIAATVVFLWPSALSMAWRPFRVGFPAVAIVWAFLALEPVLHCISPAILLLADASYAIYLFHVLLMPLLVKVVPLGSSFGQQVMLVVLCVLASMALGTAIHRWIERPLLSWFRQQWRVDGQKVIQVV